jgi:hypothetical protein|tara:strand:- start:379 stop:651 length:273 start_codon:yes stop_codon:yes gene_type:complete
MMYVLINSAGEIVDKIDSITPGGAVHYFMERKKMYDKKKFYEVWKVKTKKEYDLNQEAFGRKPSSEQIQWWKDEETYLDVEAPITKSNHG